MATNPSTMMWIHLNVAYLIIHFFFNCHATQTHSVLLQFSRITPGLRCVNSITETVTMKSVASCVIYGDSLYDCHAVNYNARDQICEVIASNGVVMHVQNRDDFILATFGNIYDFIKTGVEVVCALSVVQWREQFTQAYVEYDNLANSYENTRDGYVCKVSVGDNEFPGTASVASRRCTFIHNGYAGFAEIHRVLVLEASSNLEPVWKSYNVGDLFPSEAFVGGRKADGTLLYICRTLRGGVYFVGYYDPSDAMASVATGSVEHPTEVDLLCFVPNGPTSAGPTVDLACPCFHVVQVHSEVDWVEHRGPETMPTGVVLGNSYTAVAQSSDAFSTIAKFIENGDRFCLVYGTGSGCQTWGYLMTTHLSHQWVYFQAGSKVPFNAVIGAYTPSKPTSILRRE